MKKFKNARQIFETGTRYPPFNAHLYHAWVMHEQSSGNISKARELFDMALEFDMWNGYVCHAYGLLEMYQQHSNSNKGGDGDGDGGGEDNRKRARKLWQQGLTYQPSAALVYLLGHLYTTSGHALGARELYSTYIPKLTNLRERNEVYLAASSLEESAFQDVERASELLKEALSRTEGEDEEVSVHDSRDYVALARLETSRGPKFGRDKNKHNNNNVPPSSAATTTNITTTMRLPGAAFLLGPLWVRPRWVQPLWVWPCAMGTTEMGIIDLWLNAIAEKRVRAVCFIA